VIGAAAVVLFWWTWGKWADVILDFGREVYVPWRLTEGEVLYRDIAYFNGPLSPYVNSLWFRLFGTSLRTLALANFALLGIHLSLWYAVLSRAASRTAAFLACLVFVGVFALSRYTIAGNYNYICPYSHETTHGLTLSLGALWFLARYTRSGKLADAGWCGLLVGLVFLTKPEVFLAVAPACVLGLGLAFAAQQSRTASLARMVGVFSAALATPIVVAVLLLAIPVGLPAAVSSTLGGWKFVFASRITSLPFYQRSMGIDQPIRHLAVMLSMLFWCGVVLGMPAGLGLLNWQSRWRRLLGAVACFVVVAGSLLWNFDEIPVSDTLRPLPVVLGAALVALLVAWSGRPTTLDRGQLSLMSALALFGLLMTAKIVFHVRITHYGYYLSMPATLVMVALVWDYVPVVLARLAGTADMLRGAFLAVLLLLVARCLVMSDSFLKEIDVPVGTGADAFMADARGTEINRILGELDQLARPGGTLAVAPEGIMLNYLTRRRDPVPYISLMPVEMLMFGEEPVLAAFKKSPPDYFVLTDEDVRDYGYKRFHFTDDGYADELAKWFHAHYRFLGEKSGNPQDLLHAILLERKQ